jgi:hypothetical protein
MLAAAGAAVTCGGGSHTASPLPVVPTPVPSVSTRELLILGAPSTLVLRETIPLHAAGRLSDQTYTDVTDDVTWGSSDPRACQVSAAGLLTATGAGTATISAELGPLASRATVACGYVLTPIVHENPPTTSVFLDNVRVDIVGGPLAGQTFVTGASGRVTLPPVAAPGFFLHFTKAGHDPLDYEVFELPRQLAPDIAMMPEPDVTDDYSGVRSPSSGCGAGTSGGPILALIPLTVGREGRVRTTVEGDAEVHLVDGSFVHVPGYEVSSTRMGDPHSVERIVPAGSYSLELFCLSGPWHVTVLRPR